MNMAGERVLSGVPKGETVYATLHPKLEGGPVYYVTSKADRSVYYLYEVLEKGIRKVGRAESPAELEEKYVKYDKAPDNDDDDYPDPYENDISVTPFELLEHEKKRRGDYHETEESKNESVADRAGEETGDN